MGIPGRSRMTKAQLERAVDKPSGRYAAEDADGPTTFPVRRSG